MSHVRGCQPSFVVKLQTSRYSRNYYFNSELSSETFVLIVVRLLGVQFEVFFCENTWRPWNCFASAKKLVRIYYSTLRKCVMSLVWATDFSGLHWAPSSSRFTFYQPEHELFNTELDHSHFRIKLTTQLVEATSRTLKCCVQHLCTYGGFIFTEHFHNEHTLFCSAGHCLYNKCRETKLA